MPSPDVGGGDPTSGNNEEWTRCPAGVSERVEQAWQEFLEAIRPQVKAAIKAAAEGAIERNERVGDLTLREYVQGVDFAKLPQFQEVSGSSEPSGSYPTRLAECHSHLGRLETELSTLREKDLTQGAQDSSLETCWKQCHSFPCIDKALEEFKRIGMRRTIGDRSLHGVIWAKGLLEVHYNVVTATLSVC
eukprot:Nk52_evm11s503 gene=Nk52_evmTU11s503